jgi:hypothetical protein
VVVVVTYAQLEPGRTSGRLDPPDESRGAQGSEGVVERLFGYPAETILDRRGQLVHICMRMGRELVQQGKPYGRHPEPGTTQQGDQLPFGRLQLL